MPLRAWCGHAAATLLLRLQCLTCAWAGGTDVCPMVCMKVARAPGPSELYTIRPQLKADRDATMASRDGPSRVAGVR